MKTWTYFLLAFFTFSCASNASNTDNDLPDVVNLDSLQKTDFLESFDKKFELDRNGIYCFTINEALEQSINALPERPKDHSNPNLEKLIEKKYHKNVLNSNEFIVIVNASDNVIEASTEMNIALPFEFDAKKYKQPFLFNNESEVKAFSPSRMYMFDLIDLNYYINDKDFSITLNPEDENHKIILVMTDFKKYKSLKEVFDLYFKKYKKAEQKRKNDDFYWKNFYLEEDVVIIPNFSYNIQNNYEEYEGSTFISGKDQWEVTQFYQRIGFVLNEKGALIESKAKVSLKKEEKEERRPKNLIFDKPFVIFIKRTDKNLPYFGMYVANSELMEIY